MSVGKEDSPIVIGGCGRSGTTIFRLMLDAHPSICCGPESNLLLGGKGPRQASKELARKFDLPEAEVLRLRDQHADHGAFVRSFFELFRMSQGADRWADKTPRNVRHLDGIWRMLPTARFVHVVRDGRDVVCSLRTHPRFRVVDGNLVPTGILRDLDECMDRWIHDVEAGIQHQDDPRYLEVRYEELVGAPEATMRRVLDDLGEPWSDAVLAHHEITAETHDPVHFPQNAEAVEPVSDTSVERWRTDLTADEQSRVAERLGPLLLRLGYEP